ncbi:PAAR domain-containing protein [Spartinivicinus ruber]
MPETHAGVTLRRSPNHIINGKPVARVGDSVSCRSTIATGEANHSING